ncbi:MAG: CPBP family intramembrane glutamic endopeptidase [Armatimonadota bacterium]|nr:CPBP family intramembrane metalloprotease [Armatimonadota bacterium]MCX7777703.1 CPBP family intramembrane metalloprotease [Armatimonadota bacterium]MDW8025462.1 CPBP family intramembrane glutamic endopeptidase [Armatimonadota bacterium]
MRHSGWLGEKVQTAITFVCALMLIAASVTMPVNRNEQFGQYVLLNFLLCFILPAALTKATGWKWNDVGLRLGKLGRGLMWTLIALVVMTPLLILCARMPQFQAHYPFYAPARYSTLEFIKLAIGMTIYMFGWEFLFRGFILFSLKRQIGIWAIGVQALPFWLAHIGKPQVEFISALPGGVISGLIAWHCESFLPMFVIHSVIYVLFNAFVILLGS